MATKAKSAVVFLVNPAAASHNILPVANHRKEILVVVTGEENDHEVLALAKRFMALPQVTVTLIVIENENLAFDERVRAAVSRFQAGMLNISTQSAAAAAAAAGCVEGGSSSNIFSSTSGGHISSTVPVAESPHLIPSRESALSKSGSNGSLSILHTNSTGNPSLPPVVSGLTTSSGDGSSHDVTFSLDTKSSSSGGRKDSILPTATPAVAAVVVAAAAAAAAPGGLGTLGSSLGGAGSGVPRSNSTVQPPRIITVYLSGHEANKDSLLEVASSKVHTIGRERKKKGRRGRVWILTCTHQ
jgi:hypothetical protein